MICMVSGYFAYTSCIYIMYIHDIYTYDECTVNNIYIYIYIYWTSKYMICIYIYVYMTCDKVYIWYEISGIWDLIDKVKFNRVWKHFHTFRKEAWTMDRRTRAVMFVTYLVHSPQINEFDWTILHNFLGTSFEEQYSIYIYRERDPVIVRVRLVRT